MMTAHTRMAAYKLCYIFRVKAKYLATLNNHFKNLNEILQEIASSSGEKQLYAFKRESGNQEYDSLTSKQLLHNACNFAAKLRQVADINDRALLIYPPGLEYITAFWACLLAGVIAIPAYPPLNKDTVNKLEAIINNAKPSVILSDNTTIKNIKRLSSLKMFTRNKLFKSMLDRMLKDYSDICRWDFRKFVWLSTSDIDNTVLSNFVPVDREPDEIAFLQYTSGSTADPKGVIISHGNMLANVEIIKTVLQIDSNSSCVSWLPPYHDMGLITSVIMPAYVGGAAYLMSPIAFLRSPISWLEALTKFKSRYSGGPNFAYDYCVNKIAIDDEITLDLSHWGCAFNSAEPVRAKTMERFANKFRHFGFDKRAFTPAYGLAEATLMVAAPKIFSGFEVKTVDANKLANDEIVSSNNLTTSKRLISTGRCLQDVAIVDPKNFTKLSCNHIGEIWIRGPSVAKGFWNNPDATAYSFNQRLDDQDGFLRTGDLGFIDENGNLYITGRLKDLIIISGKKFYPQDIEQIVTQSDSRIRAGCVIAFSYPDVHEKLAIVSEIKTTNQEEFASIQSQIVRSVAREFGITPNDIVLIPPKKIPKTTSGKVRRQHTKKLFLEHNLAPLYSWSSNIS